DEGELHPLGEAWPDHRRGDARSQDERHRLPRGKADNNRWRAYRDGNSDGSHLRPQHEREWTYPVKSRSSRVPATASAEESHGDLLPPAPQSSLTTCTTSTAARPWI